MSTIVTLYCPLCGQKLKIKDASLFGKSVKCPGCKKSFVLHDPNAPAASPVPAPAPSTASAEKPSASRASQPAFPDFSSFEDHGDEDVPPLFAPPAGRQTSSTSPEPFFPSVSGLSAAETRVAPAENAPPWGSGPAPGNAAGPGPIVPADMPLESSAELLISRRKSRKGARWINLALGVVLLGSAIGVGTYLATVKKPIGAPSVAKKTQSAAPSSFMRPADPNEPYSRTLLEADPELVGEFQPTSGKPIELYMMPSGINMLIHLHPARFFSDEYEYKVLRASLTDDVVGWMKEQIKGLTLTDPEKIEDLTIGILLGARGVPPQYCCVVRLAQPEKLTALIDLFPGKYLYDITERPNLRIKVDGTHGYLIHDERTYAVCPEGMAADLEYSIETPNQDVSVGMAELLGRTDRDRMFTAIADVHDLQIHLSTLLPVSARPFFQQLTDWLGEEIEMASWSIHPSPYFHSQLALRPVTTKEVAVLEAEVKSKLAALPERIWKDVCEKMQPREMRFRTLIGRLPAMLQAVSDSTISQREKRCVLLTTVLPAKATPNLALATLFTLDEATRTSFTSTAVAASPMTRSKLPETVAERLKIPVDAEFNRTPFEQAVTYLGNEIQVNVVVDGDALKDAGYTKNMPQTFNLGKVPVQKALFQIVNSYQEKDKEMVISIDEKSKTIHVLTKKFADAKGLPVYPLTGE